MRLTFFFFSGCFDSQISLIQSEVATPPLASHCSLLSPSSWGLLHLSGNNIRSKLLESLQGFTSHVTSPVEGGGFTLHSYEITLQKNGHFILTTLMWRSQDHFGNATFTLSLSLSAVALQRVSTFHGLFYALPQGAPV